MSRQSNSPGSTESGLNGALSLFGGGRRDDSKFDLFLTIIKTEGFAHHLEQKYHYIEQTRGDYEIANMQGLIGLLGSIMITPSAANDTTVLSLQTRNKEFAKQFLSTVFFEGNQTIRQMDTQRAEKFSSYIEERFKSEPNKAMQDALVSLLITQERFLMVTKVDLPYAVELLDGPTVSIRPTSPKKKLLLAIGFVVGFCVGVAGVLVRDAVAEERYRRGFETPELSAILAGALGWLKEKLQGLIARFRRDKSDTGHYQS